MKYEKLADDILKNVGGKENVISLIHCITRLRFKLKNESKANKEALNKLDGVVEVIQSGGQYQVVIGTHVEAVYKDVVAVGGFAKEVPVQVNEEKRGLFAAFLDVIMGVMSPILGLLAASGIIKGLNTILLLTKVLTDKDGTYVILNAIGDSLFYFLPIILGYTAAKKFKLKEVMGMTLGGILVYPSLTALSSGKPLFTVFNGTFFQSSVNTTFLKIPVMMMNYASTLIPIILTVYVASKIEKVLTKILPDVVKTFAVPFLTLIISAPLALLIIAPVSYFIGDILGVIANGLISLNPGIAGLFIGTFWSLIVMCGLHWGIIPLIINNLSTLHYDVINPLIYSGGFATCATVLAVIIKTNNVQLRNIAIPALLSSFLGINEPSLYGVLIPRKKLFISTMVASGIGAAVAGFSGSKLYNFAGSGIQGTPGFISPNGIDSGFIGLMIGTAISMVIAFVAVFVIGLDAKETDETGKRNYSV
ncbi:phosphotransferase system eiib cysteine phosphorylation site [Lucifera butyrica]|uniref:Phosphotransferase system eiib cysteine phosphorylation site n=1 Tax=Lucifera butyrica TaxID=1351585 RepID=A0A498RDZ4_9FIRM|nr:PTS transporter subunit EIIC [Lucifera butyrica]VBB09549.1 phosphotransferase system eiib cysteine phosphorylation site [Lucifera butyrica]